MGRLQDLLHAVDPVADFSRDNFPDWTALFGGVSVSRHGGLENLSSTGNILSGGGLGDLGNGCGMRPSHGPHPTSFYQTPHIPGVPDNNLGTAVDELKYTFGYRKIKKQINELSGILAIGGLSAFGITYLFGGYFPSLAELSKKKKKRPY